MEKEEEKLEEISEEKEEVKKEKTNTNGIVGKIFNLLMTILLLFVIFETVIGILDMNKIKNNEKPIWYINSNIEKKDNKKTTYYNLGLYIVTKVETEEKTTISLKPFFLK